MKLTAVVALVMLWLSIPSFGQDKTSCRAFFQVVRADTQTPEGLRPGMDEAQKKWWENKGQKEYPELCLNGSVSNADKPRYLLIWSKSGLIEKTAVAPGEVYGQTASAIQSAAPKEWVYRPRWDEASISIVSVSYEGDIDLPAVHIAAGDRAYGWFWPDSPKVLEVALKYLAQEEQPESKHPAAAAQQPFPPSSVTQRQQRGQQ